MWYGDVEKLHDDGHAHKIDFNMFCKWILSVSYQFCIIIAFI